MFSELVPLIQTLQFNLLRKSILYSSFSRISIKDLSNKKSFSCVRKPRLPPILMLNAVNINLMAFSSYVDNNLIQGQVFTIFVITVAAAEAAVGLAILLSLYRNRVTVDMESFNLLKW